MDNSYWYYTLSAIPQTLAAGLALAATFVIFKMSLLNDQIETRASEMAKLLALAGSGSADDGEFKEQADHKHMLKIFAGVLPALDAQPELVAKIASFYGGAGARPDLLDRDDPAHHKVVTHLKRLRHSFTGLLEHKRRSFGYLKRNLIFTLAPMSASLFLLPLHDYIEHDPFHGVLIDDLIVAVLVGCTIASLCYTAYSVWKIANY